MAVLIYLGIGMTLAVLVSIRDPYLLLDPMEPIAETMGKVFILMIVLLGWPLLLTSLVAEKFFGTRAKSTRPLRNGGTPCPPGTESGSPEIIRWMNAVQSAKEAGRSMLLARCPLCDRTYVVAPYDLAHDGSVHRPHENAAGLPCLAPRIYAYARVSKREGTGLRQAEAEVPE